MKPYYETPLGKLYHGDCLEIMPQLEPVDLVLTDPPYGTTACKWDLIVPIDLMWAQLKTIIKKNGVIAIMAMQPFESVLISSKIKMFKYCWVWVKTQAVGHLNAYKMPMKRTEDICIFYNKPPTYNPLIEDKPIANIRPPSQSDLTDSYGKYNQDQSKNRKIPLNKTLPTNALFFSNAQKTVHPTQKPVALMEYLIKTYTNEGETVLDFCIGSGTTSVACERLKRRWIGIEIEEKYCEIAAKRIEQERKQLKLF